jgi:hypothetical protein
MIFSVIIPFAFGILLVGAMTQRVLSILKGNLTAVAALSVLISCVYWFNIQYVVSQDILAYCSFGAGTLVVTCALAYKEKLKAKAITDAEYTSQVK